MKEGKLGVIDINRSTAMNAGLYPRTAAELNYVQVGPGNKNEALAIAEVSKGLISPLRASQSRKEAVLAQDKGIPIVDARTTLVVEDAVSRAIDGLLSRKANLIPARVPDGSEVRREATITRAVEPRNGKPREAAIWATRRQGDIVYQIVAHSIGKDVRTGVVVLNPDGTIRREGDTTQIIEDSGKMGSMKPISKEVLNRS